MNFLTNLFSPGQALPPLRRTRRGIELKSDVEIERMRESSRIVAKVLQGIADRVQPGMTTADLDAYAEEQIRAEGATPSFKGYHGFPASICACLNDQVVHGIPSRKAVIRNGDLLKVDTGAFKDGYHGDSCITIAVGRVKPARLKLMQVAEKALYQGIAQVKPGNRLLDIAGAIEDYVKPYGYSIVDDFTGHGVGRNLHEPPAVFHARTDELPNEVLKPGMTLAIEPIINAGSKVTRTLRDRWMVVTADQKCSAQFEHTVLVTADGHEILSDRTPFRR
ncbi:type I methionyl aminopeptidase [Spirulina major CS-329]|uniref:type I methionyl aminopeptidase n=1 Tax=Spirulina TaxID=1154 RepID=UPI00232C8F0D|nr:MULTISPECIES: type I methionyl aminopeptidase [Spirulina]MDB9494237.1 type I methionyl aminopeptidase [Spirulina subsalsa CS-330]MDB9501848.1 type I methionyl aminopeptidase [Spirulina major CS-329]